MGDSGGNVSQGELSSQNVPGKETERSDQGFSLDSLSQALPDYGTTPASESQQQQSAGQAYSPNYQSQSNFQQQIPNYRYQNQQQRVIPSPLQTQYPAQNMYQGQQPVFYQQFAQSPQYYSGQQRSPNDMSGRGYGSNLPQGISPTWNQFSNDPFRSPTSPARSIPSVPRGPPRKPKQSGHALWVGNLPPGALVNDLKDHFSRDATNDIESVFLISKSNCAFVNYKTEEACAAATTRFHDSRFNGVRLVCRLRRVSTNPAGSPSGIPTAPAALASTSASAEGQTALEAVTRNREESTKAEEASKKIEGADKINDKYFIVKSLTVEDLELSARNGIWATQAHNEETLNKAYESVDNVYLIFSANKSGEYFGYARMSSPINEASAAELDWKPPAPTLPVNEDPDLPRSIPTPATETAPKGRIIDDSARGTIFWEADISDFEDQPELSSPAQETTVEDMTAPGDSATQQQPYGHPFRIQWLSTSRLPFYRTRGLRNPWNSNREVKIARDGTELETGTGRRLVAMFHQPSGGVGSPVGGPSGAGRGRGGMQQGFGGPQQFFNQGFMPGPNYAQGY